MGRKAWRFLAGMGLVLYFCLPMSAVVASTEISGVSNTAPDPAEAHGTESVAVGDKSKANRDYATAIGVGANATIYSTAVGAGSFAVGGSSSAFGVAAQATNDYDTATGVLSSATGKQSTANGSKSSASGLNSSAFGYNAQASGANSVAIGANAVATQDNTVSVGAVGSERRIVNVANGVNDTDAVNLRQLNALGSSVSALSGTAVGADSLALGRGSVATASNSVAIGVHSVADRPNTVSVGAAGSERQIANLADGTAPTDAVNVRQLQRSGALSAALSGLGVLPYDAAQPLQMTAAVGAYGEQRALAFGLNYYADRAMVVNCGVATAGGETMGRLGFTWRIGKGNSSPTPLAAAETEGLRSEVKTLKRELNELREMVAELKRNSLPSASKEGVAQSGTSEGKRNEELQ